MKLQRYGNYVRFEDMTWPLPMGPVEWKLRYGSPTKEDLLAAAGILAAYHQMIFDPESKRRKIIKGLRWAYDDRGPEEE